MALEYALLASVPLLYLLLRARGRDVDSVVLCYALYLAFETTYLINLPAYIHERRKWRFE